MSESEFSEIYSKFYHKIKSYLVRLVGENEAEDVTQAVFEKVNKNLSTFKGDSKISTWIFKIATNTALDRLKSPSYKRTPFGPLAPIPLQTVENIEIVSSKSASPDQKVIRDEMSDCIREFVDRLPPDYKTIITLNELEGFTNREIAEILEITLETTKIRLHRARAKLKESLESGCDFYLDGSSELACDRKQPNDDD